MVRPLVQDTSEEKDASSVRAEREITRVIFGNESWGHDIPDFFVKQIVLLH